MVAWDEAQAVQNEHVHGNTERIEFLAERLKERDVTLAEVHEYLSASHPPTVGMQQQPLASFVSQQDLDHFWWLYDWWGPVLDKPKQLPTPAIIQFCWYINHTPGTPAVTFGEGLKQFYARCYEHCEANGLPVQNPGETPEERKKRKNRERMAEVRGHRRVPDSRIKDDATKEQVRKLEEDMAATKEEAKETDTRLKAEVIQHQKAMMEASGVRKSAAAHYKSLIDNIKDQIANLTAKR